MVLHLAASYCVQRNQNGGSACLLIVPSKDLLLHHCWIKYKWNRMLISFCKLIVSIALRILELPNNKNEKLYTNTDTWDIGIIYSSNKSPTIINRKQTAKIKNIAKKMLFNLSWSRFLCFEIRSSPMLLLAFKSLDFFSDVLDFVHKDDSDDFFLEISGIFFRCCRAFQ